ncbi:MAG: ATP-dependent DNA helicase, partial [Planctomycetes bacterium]|nr:ATP-dependent DNA helicase [Planctomycetota bacterium]
MDLDGLLALLQRIRAGTIALREIDRSGPSPFAEGVLHALPYSFLDDAPLEERRTQAVVTQRTGRRPRPDDGSSELDPAALAEVAAQSWPDPRSAEELHEALGWMGWLEQDEVAPAWRPWLDELAADGRAERADDRWFAAGASREPVAAWRGRLEAVIPVPAADLADADAEALRALEAEGTAMRARCAGQEVWTHRRLLARVRRLMVERLRAAVEPRSPAAYAEFLLAWQGATATARRGGPAGLRETLRQLASAAFPAEVWEDEVLPQRLQGYHPEWLDQCTLGGEFTWLRLWGPWRGPLSRCAVAILPRTELGLWLELPLERARPDELGAAARTLHELLRSRGASFPTDLQAQAHLLPSQLEEGLAELVGSGLATCDSFAALRQLAMPPSQRRFPVFAVGRWSLVPWPPEGPRASEDAVELAATSALQR